MGPLEIKYDDAEHAFFSMVDNQRAKADGANFKNSYRSFQRPGAGIDTQKVIERLYRQHYLTHDHIRVLRFYGIRNMRPDERREKEYKAAKLWDEAMKIIQKELEAKGMV